MTATCKLGEKGCWNDGKCRATINCENKVITNADRIRAMTDEELAEWLCDNRHCIIPKECPGYTACRSGGEKANGLKTWLKQPAEVECE